MTWGHTLGGSSSGLSYFGDAPLPVSAKCRQCGLVFENFLLGYRPTTQTARKFSKLLTRLPIVESVEGFLLCSDSFRSKLDSALGSASPLIEFGEGVNSFDLTRLPTVTMLSVSRHSAKYCDTCEQWSPLYIRGPFEWHAVLSERPDVPLLRSTKIFGSALGRRPALYLRAKERSILGLPQNGWELLGPHDVHPQLWHQHWQCKWCANADASGGHA